MKAIQLLLVKIDFIWVEEETFVEVIYEHINGLLIIDPGQDYIFLRPSSKGIKVRAKQDLGLLRMYRTFQAEETGIHWNMKKNEEENLYSRQWNAVR